MTPEVTIIVCFRNEVEHIPALLKALAAQTFKAFELILVDDFSDDNTVALASAFLRTTSIPWQIITLSEHLAHTAALTANKKKGIALAIAQSSTSTILLTDADCIMSENWISTMLLQWRAHRSTLCFGPVRLANGHSLFKAFQEIDLVAMMEVTAWTIHHQLPMLGNAANMIIAKADFIAMKGYSGNENVSSGDDIFLLQKCIQSGKSVHYIRDENAIVTTYAEEHLNGFVQQRIRWAGKSTAYQNWGVQLALAGVYVLNVAMVLLCIGTIFGLCAPYLLVAAFCIKMGIDALIIFPGLVFFKRKILILGMPVFECMHILYVVCIGFLSLKKSYIWKGRWIKQ